MMTIKQIKEVIGEFQKYLNNKHHSSSGIFYIYIYISAYWIKCMLQR